MQAAEAVKSTLTAAAQAAKETVTGQDSTPESQAQKIVPQSQDTQPGQEHEMTPRPIYIRDTYRGSNKLLDKVAIITGGDSGIGRAVAVHFAREGADVAIVYKDEHKDAQETEALVKKEGRKCLLFPADVSQSKTADDVVNKVVSQWGKLDIVVNNASMQEPRQSITEITDDQLDRTFRTNVFGYFYFARAAVPHLKEGSCIINTSSITAYKGMPVLVDYSATKGAQISFTRALSQQLIEKGIRVNAVAPGPIWTPLIPATFGPNLGSSAVGSFKESSPMKRAGQPAEVAPCYVFLASEDASYISGQTLHPNGGEVVNG
eukprot:jgi/Chrzof1/7620/Cz02g30150.t1